jgi:hypothetical protein
MIELLNIRAKLQKIMMMAISVMSQ